MHGKQTPAGAAFYTCNHPNIDDPDLTNAIEHKKLVACVAMEYSKTNGVSGGRKFTKFLTFGPTGELLQSVNLDGRGEKFMPGSCVVCHGASRQSEYVLGGGRFADNGTMSPISAPCSFRSTRTTSSSRARRVSASRTRRTTSSG